MRALRQRGFTFIELGIVMAIMAILAAVAIPAFIKNAKKADETSTTDALSLIGHAEDSYQAGVGSSTFGSAKDLFHAGLIDATLASGRDFGYDFALNVTGGGQHYDVTACPAAINRSGDHCFATDDTGTFSTFCPPGQHPDPGTGLCVPQDTYLDDVAIATCHSIDQLSGGSALPIAKALASAVPDLVQLVAAAADTNHDGLLTSDEILNANLLGPTYAPLMKPLFDAVGRDLGTGIANAQNVGVAITSVSGELLAFLNRVPPATPGVASR